MYLSFLYPFDGTLRLWSDSGECACTIRGSGSRFAPAALSPDGLHVLTVSDDGAVLVWDDRGRVVDALRGRGEAVTVAMYSPDGTRILTGTGEPFPSTIGTVRLWRARPRDLLALADERAARGFSQDELARYGELLGDER